MIHPFSSHYQLLTIRVQLTKWVNDSVYQSVLAAWGGEDPGTQRPGSEDTGEWKVATRELKVSQLVHGCYTSYTGRIPVRAELTADFLISLCCQELPYTNSCRCPPDKRAMSVRSWATQNGNMVRSKGIIVTSVHFCHQTTNQLLWWDPATKDEDTWD